LKIITWNCNGALRKKWEHIQQFDADIYIIQECENPSVLKNAPAGFQLFSKNHLWKGNDKNKGIGVFGKESVVFEKLFWDHNFRGKELQWFLPVKVNSEFNLIAVWNHHADAKAFSYIGQFWQFMQNNKKEFNQCIICGDFNSNNIWDSWDRWWNHSDCVRELSELNIHSIYHMANKIEQGKEVDKTFYLQRNPEKGYHIDYIFAHSKFISEKQCNFQLGQFSDWKEFSDHIPLTWSF
jgi:exonuclease III